MTTPRSCASGAISETLIHEVASRTCETFTLATCCGKPNLHHLGLGGVKSKLAGLQAGLDVNKTCCESSDCCLSIPGRCADAYLGIIVVLVQVEAVMSNNEVQLSRVRSVQQQSQTICDEQNQMT